jgi:hypothetical protein
LKKQKERKIGGFGYRKRKERKENLKRDDL